jgi:NADH dehydrogenase
MNLFITGIDGFLGSRMAREFRGRGHVVTGSSPFGGAGIVRWRFGEPLNSSALVGTDVMVHCAYDRDVSIERNIEGTKTAAGAAQEAGAARQIFISSYSARPDATAAYGKIKYALETWFLNCGHAIVRPGLVIGPGGLFAKNMRRILRTPVIPLVDGGRDLLPLIDVDDFAAAMTVLVESSRPGAYNLFDERLIPLRDLVDTINRAAGHRAVRCSLPLGLADFLLRLSKRLGVPIPVDADNLRALKENQQPIHQSNLASLIPTHSPLEASIERAVRDYLRKDRISPTGQN